MDVQQLRDLFEDEEGPKHGDVCGPSECWAPAYQQLKAGGRVLLVRLDALEEVADAAEGVVAAYDNTPPGASANPILDEIDAMDAVLARLREGKA